MFNPFRSSSHTSLPPLEKDISDLASTQSLHTAHQPCPHQNSPPTPLLDAHLRQASARARIESLRDALSAIIDADNREDGCLKCATTQAASSLFSYLTDVRNAKRNGEFGRKERKAMKKEIKVLVGEVKGEMKVREGIGATDDQHCRNSVVARRKD